MKISLETRKKISEKMKGIPKSKETIENMKKSLRAHLIDKEQEICDRYQNGETIKKLCKEYKSSSNTISQILKENNIRIRANGEDFTIDIPEDKFQLAVSLYNSGKTLKETAKEIGYGYGTLRKRFIENGIHIRTYKELERKPCSEETKKKISAKNKGHKVNQKSIDGLKKHNETITKEEKKIKYAKIFKSLSESQKYCKSKTEEKYYQQLLEEYKGKTILRQYKDEERYPFYCDFYIVEDDLFIEINAHWTHGKHPFNKDSIEDLEKLMYWKERAKESEFYKTAIEVWTERDVNKIKKARENNLNYITIY